MTTDDIDTDAGRWLPISEASRIFQRSERTIRRWVSSGQMTARQVKGRTFVLVNVQPDAAGQSSDTGRIDDRRIAELTARLEEVSRQRDYLEQALAAALSKIPQIEAKVSEPTKRKWWEFWR